MDLSIVIVSYRTPDLLRRCLSRLSGHDSRWSREIVVVDNASGDASADIARSFAGVTVIENQVNTGFAGGVNRGLAAAKGRFILILNPDIEVQSGSLDALTDFLETHPETGIVAPKLLNSDGTLQYSCRRFYTLKTVLLRRTVLGRLFPNSKSLRRHLMLDYDHDVPEVVDWVAGAAMMVRREALDDVGTMDERYFLYFEDVDWCTRMHARGWAVHYVPDSVMIHHWQRASSQLNRSARTHLRSGLKFYERWGGLIYVLRQYRPWVKSAALISLDAVAIVLSFLVAFVVRRELAFVFDKPVWPLGYYGAFITASVLVFLGAFGAAGLHREVKEGDWVDVAFRVARGATWGALLLMASTFVLDMRAFSRVMVLGSWPLVGLFAFLNRRLLRALFSRARRERVNLHRVTLLGQDDVLDRLETVMRSQPELGWEPVRIRGRTPSLVEDGESLVRRLASERVTEVVVTPASFGVHEEHLGERLVPLRRAGLRLRVVSSFLAYLPPRARLEAVGDLSWLSLERPGLRPPRFSKRLLDLGLATFLAGVGGLPALAVILARAVAGKPIREPERVFVGRWRETFAVRPLAGGGWLRGYPVLGRVFRGSCSLVGPRPLEPGAEIPGGNAWERIREGHRPGLIGPWSLIPARSLDEEMHQELRYLEEWSPELDLKLLARVALRRSGGSRGSGSPLSAPRHDISSDSSRVPSSPTQEHSVGIQS